jgi:hypothetical protein
VLRSIRPDAQPAGIYERLYPTYRGLYSALKPAFDAVQ